MAGRAAFTPRQWRVALAALALFAIVFFLRSLRSEPGDGITFLYVLPIALVAFEFGRWWGLAAGAFSLGLVALWVAIDLGSLGVVPYLTRGVVFLLTGYLTGLMAERLHSTAATAATAARHFELSRDLLCTATFDGYLVEMNEAWQETLGWSPEELKSKPFVEFVHPADRERTRDSAGRLREGDRPAPLLNRYMTKDGGYRWIEWSSSSDREQGLIYAAARDVTERVHAQEQAREAQERFRRAFADSPAGIALVGVRGEEVDRLIEVNEALVELIGIPREQLIGANSLGELTHPDDVGPVGAKMQQLVAGEIETFRIEMRLLVAGGGERWVDLTASTVTDAEGEPLYRISQLYDVDDRRRAEERLRHLADHDALSGLYNRRRFHEELSRELLRGSRGAVLLCDLDKFKEVNDTLGHAAGDAVIERVGAALTERLRTSDVTARVGGDEFAIILRRVTPPEADRVAAELLEFVEAALRATTEGAAVSLSIGVAPFQGGDGRGPDELLKAADEAMYRAKGRGGSAVARAVP